MKTLVYLVVAAFMAMTVATVVDLTLRLERAVTDYAQRMNAVEQAVTTADEPERNGK